MRQTGLLVLACDYRAVRMNRKKKRQRDIVRYERWLRIKDVYPDLTFGEFLRNGRGGSNGGS